MDQSKFKSSFPESLDIFFDWFVVPKDSFILFDKFYHRILSLDWRLSDLIWWEKMIINWREEAVEN